MAIQEDKKFTQRREEAKAQRKKMLPLRLDPFAPLRERFYPYS
jgi:hypothetical protein